MKRVRGKLTYANVVSTLCLFLLLGGGSVAYAMLSLPKNSVGPLQLKAHAVTASKVKPGTLSLADLKPGAITLPPTPYSKTESDARYLRSTITVVKTIATGIGGENSASEYVSCPLGYQALGGGVDPSNTRFEKVSASEPTFAGQRDFYLSDGQHGPADGWFGAITTQGAREGGPGPNKVVVICAPIG